ncbi:MAG: vanadium-dependent haloperoxidase [Candidatus Dependentiae bacterium]|nr:vanadium-dependent haloperoxidase [Candidatus Dependentiae bacterium]
MKKFSSLLLLSLVAQSMFAEFGESRLWQRADEPRVAYNARVNAAYRETLGRSGHNIETDNNGDETNVVGYAGSFTKLLEHDTTTGLLSATGLANYEKLIKALKSGMQVDYNDIERSAGSSRLFVNPQSGFALTMNGMDSAQLSMLLSPTLTSAEAAADMIETYLNAICRDVLFSDYGTGEGTDIDSVNGGSLTENAAAILNDLGSVFKGPRNGSNVVDASVLFRGLTTGDKTGPYVSQFSLMPLYPMFAAGCIGAAAGLIGVPNLPLAAFQVNQRYPIASDREFGVTWDDYVALQNGLIPKQYNANDYNATATNNRYPINGRDLGSYVHRDGPYESYYYALNILATRGFPISSVFPYADGDITNEGAGLTLGAPDAFGLLGLAALTAFRAAWAQKWRCHRRIRPEAMAGLVHTAKVNDTNDFGLHSSLFTTHAGYDLLAMVRAHNELQATVSHDAIQLVDAGTYLLSQMYPEASPEHPAYPSGHATGAGACVTILKAIFDNDTLINTKFTPVKVDPTDPTALVTLSNGEGANLLTVGGELNKLAFTISMARNFGGVHFRSDAWNGMLLGEAVAITVLQDHARIYQEQGFTGFQLTKFDGTKVRITPDVVQVIS